MSEDGAGLNVSTVDVVLGPDVVAHDDSAPSRKMATMISPRAR